LRLTINNNLAMASLSIILCFFLCPTFIAMTTTAEVILIVDAYGDTGQIFDPVRAATNQPGNFGSTTYRYIATSSGNGNLYMTHGRDMIVWHSDNDTSETFPNVLLENRNQHSMVSVNSGDDLLLYLCGGYGLSTATRCELCDVSVPTPLCIMIADMPEGRHWHTSVVVDNLMMYVIGGDDGNTGAVDTVLCYNIEMNKWFTECLPPMTEKRNDYPGAVVINGYELLVCGGVNEDSVTLSSCETIDVRARDQGWKIVRPMQIPRREFGLVTMSNGLVYALGGSTTDGWTKQVEAYNPTTGNWSSNPHNLNDGVWTTSAVLLQ
jgi:hypothetical protein